MWAQKINALDWFGNLPLKKAKQLAVKYYEKDNLLTEDEILHIFVTEIGELSTSQAAEISYKKSSFKSDSAIESGTFKFGFEQGVEWQKMMDEQYKIDVNLLLEKIANWELPETGKFWDRHDKEPMSYEAAYGSNGSRDYFKGLAKEILTKYK